MRTLRNRSLGGALALGVGLGLGPSPAAAQQRLLIPEGTVLVVRTENALSSTTARVGQSFRATLTEPLRVDGYTVLPQGSLVSGQITSAQPATSRESGIVGVHFDRATLTNGRSLAISGKLTSSDPEERRQIDQAGGSVVFVGGRRGVGVAVAGLGSTDANDPLSGVLGALGSIFSSGADVSVPVGSALAVQLERGVTVSVTGSPTGGTTGDPYTIYTSTAMIRAAQQALRGRNYFRGAVDGRLDDDTQRALFEFQIDNRLSATGNLDGRTVRALGLSATGGLGGALSASDAALLRRDAQSLVGQWRSYLGVQATGRLDAARDYRAADLEAYFALSGFADNASLYEQMVRQSSAADGLAVASAALAASAGRVDGALRAAGAPSRMLTAWQRVYDDLAPFRSESAGY